jgi:CheY-like chemotaxis protein
MLRASGGTLPAIFLMAKVQPGDIQHIRSLGAIDVIAKPFDPMMESLSLSARGFALVFVDIVRLEVAWP